MFLLGSLPVSRGPRSEAGPENRQSHHGEMMG